MITETFKQDVLDQYRDRWLKIGLATHRLDREDAEAKIRKCYESAGQKQPKWFRWFESPYAAVLFISVLRTIKITREIVSDQVSDQVSAQVSDQVRAQVSAQVRAQVRDLLNLGYWRWGWDDEWWWSYLEIMTTSKQLIVDQKIQDRLWDLIKAREATSVFFPFADIVVCVDNPLHIHRDDQNRLHSDGEAAIVYGDGWGVHAVHGVRVPWWVIQEPQRITLDIIRNEGNAEIRRVMIEKYGNSRYLLDSGASIEDMDSLTLVGSSTRALMKDSFGDKWLIGSDGSTRRIYYMPVPAEVKTCKEAHEAICGFDEGRLIAEC